MNRTHGVLAAALVVQLVLLVLFRFPLGGRSDGEAGGALIPALASITPTKLEIEDGEGVSITLERKGEAWTLPDAGGYPADTGRVNDVLRSMETLDTRRRVLSSSRYHAALKVSPQEHERRVRVWDQPSGKPKAELFVGTSPSYQVSHVRRADQDPVYEATGLSPYDLRTDVGSWVERQLVNVTPGDVIGIEVTNANGSFALARQDDQWTVRSPQARSGAALDRDKTTSMLSSLTSVWLEAPVGPVDEKAHGFETPAATVVLRLGAGAAAVAGDSTLALRIGAEVPGKEGERYATRSGSGYTVTLSKYAAERAMDQKLGDLLAQK